MNDFYSNGECWRELQLKNALAKRDRYIGELKRALNKAISINNGTAKDYERLSKECKTKTEKIEFLGKSAGLIEANINLRNAMNELFCKEKLNYD